MFWEELRPSLHHFPLSQTAQGPESSERHPASKRERGVAPFTAGQVSTCHPWVSTQHAAPTCGSPPPDLSRCQGGPRGLLHCCQRLWKVEPHPTPGHTGIQGLLLLQLEPHRRPPWGQDSPQTLTLSCTPGRNHHHPPPALAHLVCGVGGGWGCWGGESPSRRQWPRLRWAERPRHTASALQPPARDVLSCPPHRWRPGSPGACGTYLASAEDVPVGDAHVEMPEHCLSLIPGLKGAVHPEAVPCAHLGPELRRDAGSEP